MGIKKTPDSDGFHRKSGVFCKFISWAATGKLLKEDEIFYTLPLKQLYGITVTRHIFFEIYMSNAG